MSGIFSPYKLTIILAWPCNSCLGVDALTSCQVRGPCQYPRHRKCVSGQCLLMCFCAASLMYSLFGGEIQLGCARSTAWIFDVGGMSSSRWDFIESWKFWQNWFLRYSRVRIHSSLSVHHAQSLHPNLLKRLECFWYFVYNFLHFMEENLIFLRSSLLMHAHKLAQL